MTINGNISYIHTTEILKEGFDMNRKKQVKQRHRKKSSIKIRGESVQTESKPLFTYRILNLHEKDGNTENLVNK